MVIHLPCYVLDLTDKGDSRNMKMVNTDETEGTYLEVISVQHLQASLFIYPNVCPEVQFWLLIWTILFGKSKSGYYKLIVSMHQSEKKLGYSTSSVLLILFTYVITLSGTGSCWEECFNWKVAEGTFWEHDPFKNCIRDERGGLKT